MANKLFIGFAVLIVCHVASAHFPLLSLLGNNANSTLQLQNMTNLLAQGLANLKAAVAANPTNTMLSSYVNKLQNLAANLPTLVRTPNFNLQLSTLLTQALGNLRTSPLFGNLSNLQTLLQNALGGGGGGAVAGR